MRDNFSYYTYDVSSYFRRFLGSFSGKRVLDWGCNHSNFLRYSNDINHEKYVGVDLSSELIQKCQNTYPDADFRYYQHFNWQYNHSLKEGSWPLIESDFFDYIFCFSVYTHTDFQELASSIGLLKKHLKPGGKLLITYYDINNQQAFKFINRYRDNIYPRHLWEFLQDCKFGYLFNSGVSQAIEESFSFNKIPCSSFFSFYRTNFLAKELNCDIYHPPIGKGICNIQSCLIIS